MKQISLLKNRIMTYAWGSRVAIASLLGETVPSAAPQAELWMGAHPKAPSLAGDDRSGWRSLAELIDEHPREMLGERVSACFEARLPYLFKVLAVDKPLSLQAHPDAATAREGFQRENRLGIPLEASRRNYRDDRGKPECVCAITPFTALCGFRSQRQVLDLLYPLFPAGMAKVLEPLEEKINATGLRSFFHWLLTLPAKEKAALCRHVAARAKALSGRDEAFDWVLQLGRAYPEDVGALSPVLLNLVHLEPGQALLLAAGELHAYLAGMAVELMANSDNVLRGGLTAKHMDVAELLKVVRFEQRRIIPLVPQNRMPGEMIFPSPFAEFQLSRISVETQAAYSSGEEAHSLEIFFCLEGSAQVRSFASGAGSHCLTVGRGQSFMVPAAVPGITISGDARFYRASVPLMPPELLDSER